jgi:hypothetical protein
MFWKENVPLSYSRMRELFIQAFKQFVSDIKFYGLHCLRSGGATAACKLGVNVLDSDHPFGIFKLLLFHNYKRHFI